MHFLSIERQWAVNNITSKGNSVKTAICAAVALVCASVGAEPVLQNVVGSVQVNSKAAKVGDPVPAGASIQTGGGSRAEVRFDDGHLIALGAGTQFQLRQYAYNKAEPAKDSIILNLLVGTLRSITGALGARNPGKFSLSTPTATAGIRGTDFGAAVVPAPATASWSAGAVQLAALGDVPLGLGEGSWVSAPLQLAQVPIPSVFFTVNTGSIGVSTSLSSAIMGAGQAVAVGAGGTLSFVSAAVLPSGLSSMMSTPLAGGAAGAGSGGAGGSGGTAGAGGSGGTAGASGGAGAGTGAGAGAGAGAGTGAGAAGATTAATGAVTGAGVAAAAVVAGVVATTVSTTGTTSGTTTGTTQ